MGDPQTMVSTPGFKPRHTSASDVFFFDDFAGTDSDARRDTLIRLLGDAAKGEDVQLRALRVPGRHRQPSRGVPNEGDALMAEGSDHEHDAMDRPRIRPARGVGGVPPDVPMTWVQA